MSPSENLLLHTAPSAPSKPVELWASRIDGSRQRRLLELEPSPTQQTFSGMSFSGDGQWIDLTRGGGPTAVKAARNEADVWKTRSDGSDLQIRGAQPCPAIAAEPDRVGPAPG